MNKKLTVLIAGIVVLAIAIFAFGKFTQTSIASAQSQQTPTARPEMPDRLSYRHLFRYVNAIKKQAEEAEKNGKDATAFRTHFKHAAKLNDYQAQRLDEITVQCILEMQSTDARAKVLIATYKAQYPNGQVPHGQKPSPPPAGQGIFFGQRIWNY